MSAPLADRIRPKNLDEIAGQSHLIAPGKPLRRIIESGEIPNMVFYGPSGVGKTTVASIIAQNTNKKLYKLNATTASSSDIKDIIAQTETFLGMNGILLYLDEIQYFNKKQQQTLLEFIENGKITLIASTTENPYFYVYNAILSRSTVFEFKPVEKNDTAKAVRRAFDILSVEKGKKINVSDEVINYIASSCGGDVRKSLNCAELCVISSQDDSDTIDISMEFAQALSQKSSIHFDKDGDEHYDAISALQKSMRGSDPDAALFYLAKLLQAGDISSACRRLLVCACEDVGLAYPQIIPIVKSCVDIALQVGMPEARIPLADAVVMVCNAPKSNSAYMAINSAFADVQAGKGKQVPRNLQNMHYDSHEVQNKGQHYLYPHSYENHYIKQQYLPDDLKNTRYYEYGDNKNEQLFKQYWDKIKK